MNVTCRKEALQRPLSLLSRYIPGRPALPVLANTLLAVEDGTMVLSVTNLDVSLTLSLPAASTENGRVTLPTKAFAELIATLPSGDINLTSQDDTLTLTQGQTQAQFATITAQDFPVLPVFRQENAFSFPLNLLSDVAERVLFAAATDESRPVLTTLNVIQRPDALVFVATDGFRLSEVVHAAPNTAVLQGSSLLLPAKIIAEVLRIAHDATATELWIDTVSQSNQLALKIGDVEIFSKLIDAAYPEYTRIIPVESTTTMTASVEELLQAVKTTSVFARDTGSVIKWDINPGQKSCAVLAQSSNVGQNRTDVRIDGAGESLRVAFNARYMLDILTAIKGGTVTIACKGPLSPMLFTTPEYPDFRHVIMPIRIEE